MEFEKIKATVKKVELETTRMESEDYFEAVIGQAHLGGMVRMLEGIFGKPAWPSDKEPAQDTENLIESIGGLRKGQTLYYINKEECSAFAMLWPWQDGERITLKMSNI